MELFSNLTKIFLNSGLNCDASLTATAAANGIRMANKSRTAGGGAACILPPPPLPLAPPCQEANNNFSLNTLSPRKRGTSLGAPHLRQVVLRANLS